MLQLNCKFVAIAVLFAIMDREKAFKELLRADGQTITTQRLLMFRALARKSPISTTKLTVMMEENGVNRATAYRNLQLLRRLGVTRDVIVHGQRLVELSEDFSHHHHHFWCTSCGKLSDFDNPELDKAIDNTAATLGIQVKSHQVEMSGLCNSCLGKRDAATSRPFQASNGPSH
jgi:Fur family zinc uptake transcriptional regulator